MDGGSEGSDAALGDGAAGGSSEDGHAEDLFTRDGGGPADAWHGSVTVMVTVPGAANLLGAGHGVLPPDPAGPGHEGIFPTLVDLPAGTSRTMTVTNVSGAIDIDAAGTILPQGADGFMLAAVPAPGDISVFPVGGLAPVIVDRHAFLAGVFLGAAEPADPPDPYIANPTASTINGLLVAQMFFIGDGLDGVVPGTGDAQMFRVPDGATRLFLGILDVDYADNVGAIVATVSVSR